MFRKYTLSEIADIYDGPHATPKKTLIGPIFLGISSLINGRIDISATDFISEDDFVLWTRRIRPACNDIVFSYETRIGEAAIIPKNFKCCLGRRLGLLRVHRGKVDPRFLLYAYLGPAFQQMLRENTVHGSTVDRIPLILMPRFEITIPENIDEQRRIAHILGTLDDKIENNRKTAKTLEAMAQAIFKSWFVDFDPVRAKMAGETPESICKRLKLTPEILDLFPDRLVDSELGEIPEGWVISSFLDVCDLKGGAQPPASTFVDEPLEGYVRLLQIRDFSTDSHMTYIKDSSRLKYVTEDDILIGRYGSASGDKQKDSLGRVCRGLSGAYNVALMKLEPKSIGSEFAYQVVSSSSFYDYLQGASSKDVQAGFSKSEIANLQIVLPPRKILDHYELLGIIFWAETKLISKYQNNLSKIRDTLLPKLISGEIRVPEAEHLIENMEG